MCQFFDFFHIALSSSQATDCDYRKLLALIIQMRYPGFN